jgi:hypothetical protein
MSSLQKPTEVGGAHCVSSLHIAFMKVCVVFLVFQDKAAPPTETELDSSEPVAVEEYLRNADLIREDVERCRRIANNVRQRKKQHEPASLLCARISLYQLEFRPFSNKLDV